MSYRLFCSLIAEVIILTMLVGCGGPGFVGTFDGGGGGGADRHVLKVDGNQIATVLFRGDRGVLQVGSRKIKEENEASIVWDCSVESFSGRTKGSKWEFSLAMDKKTELYTINGYNYSVVLNKMSSVESEKFWNAKGLIHD